jgi:hypothetical protein
MSDPVNPLKEDLRRDFEKAHPQRPSLLDRGPSIGASYAASKPLPTVEPTTRAVAVLVRTDEALARLERAAEFLERLADTLEHQANQVHGRL